MARFFAAQRTLYRKVVKTKGAMDDEMGRAFGIGAQNMKIGFDRGGFGGNRQGRRKCGNARRYGFQQNESAEEICRISDGGGFPDQPRFILAGFEPIGEVLSNDRRVLPDKEHALSKPVMTFLSHRGSVASRLF